MIYTNQFKAEVYPNAIKRDFIIFEVRKENGNLYQSKIPDAALQECKAVAVAYEQGSTCYLLYRRKEADKCKLKEKLESYEDSVLIQEIAPEDMMQKNRYRLIQLILNAMPSLMAEEMYHNLTGGLYYRNAKWNHTRQGKLVSFKTLKISVTWTNCFKLDVKTFSRVYKERKKKRARYLMDSKTKFLRRVLKDDPDQAEDQFELAGEKGCHNRVDFLGFDSIESFRLSKVGILHRFLDDVKEFLKDYMTFELVQMDETKHQYSKTRDLENRDLRSLIRAHNVFLEDTIQDPRSSYLAEMLRKELLKYSDINVKCGTPDEGSVLIRIVHSPEYYELGGEQDPYISRGERYVVQHVTLENFNLSGKSKSSKEKEDACLKKVIQELAIKLDILNGEIHCCDWRSFGYQKAITFVIGQVLDYDTKYHRYCRMQVNPGGELLFDYWDNLMPTDDPIKEKIELIYEKPNGHIKTEIDGVFYEDPSNMHIISRTDGFTLPNIEQLYLKLDASRGKELLEVDPLYDMIDKILKDNPKDGERAETIKDKLLEAGPIAQRDVIRKAICLRSNIGKKLNQAYYDQTGKWISPRLKEKDTMECIFGAMLDIRFFRKEDEFYYYSGYFSNDLQQKIATACCIRKVVADNGENQMHTYLPMMEADFVRASGLTVLPFPFKYLREWRDQQEKPNISA